MKRTELPANVKACIELLTHAAEDGIPDPTPPTWRTATRLPCSTPTRPSRYGLCWTPEQIPTFMVSLGTRLFTGSFT